jgi:thiamine-phosphate pyrophosphorylase
LKALYRIIDVNINRAAEGLRVLEDLARFYYDQSELTKKIRRLRHQIRKTVIPLEDQLLSSRDAENDPGLVISQNSVLDDKESLEGLVAGNFKRAQEGLRVVEETLKVINSYQLAKIYEQLRYEAYTLEREFFGLFNKTTKGKSEQDSR